MIIDVYTDGSCHTQLCIGGWVAILLVGEEKIVLSGTEKDTTHNRMELIAVIKAMEYIQAHYTEVTVIHIFSDSQYVVGLNDRKEKLSLQHFITGKGNDIRNADLVKQLFLLSESLPVEFIKVKAHLKKDDTINYNIEADKLSRKIVREAVSTTIP